MTDELQYSFYPQCYNKYIFLSHIHDTKSAGTIFRVFHQKHTENTIHIWFFNTQWHNFAHANQASICNIIAILTYVYCMWFKVKSLNWNVYVLKNLFEPSEGYMLKCNKTHSFLQTKISVNNTKCITKLHMCFKTCPNNEEKEDNKSP